MMSLFKEAAMRVTTVDRPANVNKTHLLPAGPLGENLFAWMTPLAGERGLVSGVIVLIAAGAVLLASVLS
jgi:hypothetical protein